MFQEKKPKPQFTIPQQLPGVFHKKIPFPQLEGNVFSLMNKIYYSFHHIIIMKDIILVLLNDVTSLKKGFFSPSFLCKVCNANY